ncbi:MAG: RHS repeat protein [Williamsia sp.]|nr:RHS repeat protein [Williamsia sp.]
MLLFPKHTGSGSSLFSFPAVTEKTGKRLLFSAFGLILFFATSGQTDNYKLVRTPQNVTVNRTLPKDILSAGDAIPASFSTDPADEEIFKIHFFEEPLVPSPVAARPGENQALLYALAGYSQRKSPDDFSALLNFLVSYPDSRWRGSLLADMGLVYRRSGYFSKAVQAWQQSWDLLKKQNEPKLKNLADRVVSELLMMHTWVGEVDKMDSLVTEIDHRMIEGPAVTRIVLIRQALHRMKTTPAYSFKCGPYALNNLFSLQDSAHLSSKELMELQSTAKGFSLAELQGMSRKIGLNYQMAFREVGAEVIANAVIHWKLGHYSTLLVKDSGYYQCEDATMGTTYGQQFWLSAAALDSSASGYFLVPAGALPKGWRSVDENEGSSVFGKGDQLVDIGRAVSKKNVALGGSAGKCNSSTLEPPVPPMAQSNVHGSAVSLHVFDRPVSYVPALGPAMVFDVDYHQKDTYQPANFSYSNLGPKWTFNYVSYIQDDPKHLSANADIYLMGGGFRTFTSFNARTQSYAPEMQSNDVLVRICATCYELRHSDGSKEIYARPDGNTSVGRKIFLTEVVDIAGNRLTLSYDRDRFRIAALRDATGQVTTLSYVGDNDDKIAKVTDPFGRYATFDYDSKGRLVKITDVIGMSSSFHYAEQEGDFIDRMTTPYGTTSFIKDDGTDGRGAVLETHYPLGEKERVEYREGAPEIGSADTVAPSTGNNIFHNDYMQYRNTFFWDKKAMREAPGDYTKAKIYHWLHGAYQPGEEGYAAPILESTKEPLENRLWYAYQNQSDAVRANLGMSAQPSVIGRVLDDGTSQLTRFAYNLLGNVTSATDPSGRRTTYLYDSTNINLLEICQTTGQANELLAKYTYNGQYLPLTAIDASGMLTRFTYNQAGQLLSVTNPKKETTNFAYNANGTLKSVSGPVPGTTMNFTYDDFGRIRTMTDPEGYTITTDYDALDRPTIVTYPDSSYEQIVYDRLDAIHSRDRLGRWSHTIYDSLDRVTASQDALGRVTQLSWCDCGSPSQIIDPLKHITSFTYDLQSRLIAKTYHDGKSVSYAYEKTTSRLKEVTDQKQQKTQYSYFNDGNLKQIAYPNALVATPSVSYTFDTRYNRIATMTDGTGKTTYNYNPVLTIPLLGTGALASVDGPLANDLIAYSYDSLGRVSGRSINGVSSSVEFDILGRVTSATNILGRFAYGYVNQTDRLASVAMPNGISTLFQYFDNKGDQRLKQLWNRTPWGNTLSKFDYEYNAQAQITRWTKQVSGSAPKTDDLVYDTADQLLSVTQEAATKFVSPTTILPRYAYRYDSAGNRTSEHADYHITLSEYNSLNQLTRQTDIDTIRNKGILPVNNPVNNNVLTYDANGNTVSASLHGATYGWDAADRLVKITQGSNVIEFVYDGLSRRVAEKLNGAVIRRWLWDGTELAEERDASGSTVVKRFFAQGEQINGSKYYYTFDHLGSVREMTDTNGVVVVRYDYDPYGRRTKVSGTLDADLGFTGHYYHAASGLYLALYRAYDANLGRWLNRDPIEEEGGLNQYNYVDNKPINSFDKDGRFIWIIGGAVIGAAVNLAITYIANDGNISNKQIAAAIINGAIAGGVGAVAGPIGGSIARILGFASNQLVASFASSIISGVGSAGGQELANLVDPCHKTNPLNAALWGGIGGGISKHFFQTKNLNTWLQAKYFGATTFKGAVSSFNSFVNNSSFLISSIIGGVSNFNIFNPFK